jgi:phage portal protein BeeE/acetolactate synthase regulatory subunit
VASLLDRLFGVPQSAPAVKAVTGPGVVAWTNDVHLSSISRKPQKMAREAQAVYHNNPWAYLAENTVSGVASGVAFHVEDDRGETVPETHPALVPIYRPVEDADRRKRIKRRPMWQLTLRHGGLCGESFWYADGGLGPVPPRGFVYINPARMWEAQDKAGNLVGWVMDADRLDGRQPVGFEVEEILHFVYDPPDEGHRGIGIAEAAWRKLHLSEASDIHAEKSIRSGGRKPGIITPTDGKVFNEDEYQAIVRELRNVTDSPDAAKKSLIFKAPVDYKDAGIAPSQMQLSELMKSGRDDTLAIWKVSPSQVGITSGRGLNSGETQKYEEASTWQNAREPRLNMLREALQEDYLDQFGFTLILHLPEFDDQAPLYDLADKATNQPLTNNERRALIGLPPFEDQFIGNAIYLPSTLVPIATPVTDSDEEIEQGGEVKARLTFTDLRNKVEKAHLPKLRRALEAMLTEQKAEIAGRVEKFFPQIQAKSDHTVWWNEEREYRRLAAALSGLDDVAGEVSSKISATFFRPAKASLLERVLAFVRHRSGIRIKGINDTTREAVRSVVEAGVREGLSSRELASRIESLGEFDDVRAELIARTETGYALNDGALSTYREFGTREVFVYDGDMDAECAAANGSTWTVEQAESDPLGHPNCTRDFAPVVQ